MDFSMLQAMGELLSGDAVEKLGGRLGVDKQQAGSALSAAVPMLVTALSKNAQSGDGAQKLLSALDRDHDGSILDDVGDFIAKGDLSTGDAITNHIFGSKRKNVEKGLEKATGLDMSSVQKLIPIIAPIVMGLLGQLNKKGGFDPSGLTDLLSGQQKEIEQKEPKAASLLAGLLDTDGDGDVDAGDMMKHGLGLLGGLFKK